MVTDGLGVAQSSIPRDIEKGFIIDAAVNGNTIGARYGQIYAQLIAIRADQPIDQAAFTFCAGYLVGLIGPSWSGLYLPTHQEQLQLRVVSLASGLVLQAILHFSREMPNVG